MGTVSMTPRFHTISTGSPHVCAVQLEELEMLMFAIGVFAVVAILATLVDTALRGRNAYRALKNSRDRASSTARPKVRLFDSPAPVSSVKKITAANDAIVRLPAAA